MKKLLKLEIISTIFIIIVGSLLHFTYEWLGENIVVGAVAAVNESVWEHMKLIFWPLLVFSIIEYFLIKPRLKFFWIIKALEMYGVIIGMIAFFYTYTESLGVEILIVDILSFMVAAVIGNAGAYFCLKHFNQFKPQAKEFKVLGIVMILVLIGFFMVATYATPHLPLFKQVSTGVYGI